MMCATPTEPVARPGKTVDYLCVLTLGKAAELDTCLCISSKFCGDLYQEAKT
jgi:hypothetical protein